MTETEKNQKMIRDYQLSAKGLKRDILRLKLELESVFSNNTKIVTHGL